MWKDINRSIVFLIEAIILFKKELRLRTHVLGNISILIFKSFKLLNF